MDDFNLNSFSPETRYWIKNEFDKYDFAIDSVWISFERASALFFLLRKIPDEDFPRGKWATIQFLEAWLDKEAAIHIIEHQ